MYVLIADDHLDTTEAVTQVLTNNGHRVFSALDGDQTIRLLENHCPDALLVDLQLPKLDGFGVAQFVVKHKRFKHTKLIAFSGWSDAATMKRAEAARFDYFLCKPASPTALELFVSAPKPSALILKSKSLIQRSQTLRDRAERLSARCRAVRERATLASRLLTRLQRERDKT